MRRFFQQIKYGFAEQQGLIRQTAFHEAGYSATNNQKNRLTETIIRLRLLGKKRTGKMLALSSVLVLLLHGFGLILLWLPVKQIMSAHPLVMEVAIIPVSAPKPKVAPPPPPPPPPAAKIKPLPKKTQPKPTLKKMPVVQEPDDFAPKQQILEAQPVAQNTLTTTTGVAAPIKFEPFIEANISVDYAENPKPDYPSIARSMGWQGKVMLRVKVSEEGLSDAVEIEYSSGHDILDESALEAIKQWRFTPAKRGETPIASSVIVPIIFILQDHNQS